MNKYDKIIHLPHHVSSNHPPMSMHQRAAQFAPFAALTDHEEAINETARHLEHWVELSEHERGVLDKKFSLLLEHINEHPAVSITHFVPDPLKEGGRYATHAGVVRKWDGHEQVLTFDDDTKIKAIHIVDIERRP
ncbi:MAG: hypothetical protein Q4E55_01980 [Bacteroidales bacterium]|nr:hypothetical protein [Bacteroidales bacterium]